MGEENTATENKGQDIVKTLKDLSMRSTDLTRSNRQICMGRIGDCIDVSMFGLTIDSLINGTSFKLCSKKDKDSDLYDRTINLQKKFRRNLRERSKNELYIGYPFIEGIIVTKDSDDVSVRGPLAYFPVKLEKKQADFFLSVDESRDIVFNSNIAVMLIKKYDLPRDIGDTHYDREKPGNVIKQAVEYYKGYGLSLDIGDLTAVPFVNMTAEELRGMDPAFRLAPMMALGLFSDSSSAIQSEYTAIAADTNLPGPLVDIIKNVGLSDPHVSSKEAVSLSDISEGDLRYSGNMNASQEKIEYDLDNVVDAIVVRGPPGTGKSQTIVNMVIDAILSKKSTLIVGETQVVMDVLISRLGFTSGIMKICDPNDKDGFYNQLAAMRKDVMSVSGEDTSEYSHKVDTHIRELTEVKSKLFTPMSGFEVEPYKLFEMGKYVDMFDKESRGEYDRVMSKVSDQVLVFTYKILTETKTDFDDRGLSSRMFAYHRIVGECPWMVGLRGDLSEREVSEIPNDVGELLKKKAEWMSAGVLKKVSLGRSLKTMAKEFSKKYMSCDLNIDDITEGENIVDTIRQFMVIRGEYLRLDDSRRAYSKVLFDVAEGNDPISGECNYQLYRTVITKHLMDFESKNRELFTTMGSYDTILSKIHTNIGFKMDKTKTSVKSVLNNAMIALNHNHGREIDRILESKNRLNIKDCIDRLGLINNIRVWMMTPEAVSSVLPLRKGMFDYVIFDEASQIFVERGIPAIYRGKKIFIAGDDKQMRPYIFANSRLDFDVDRDLSDDDLDTALECESLLDLARIQFPVYNLDFHYRSKYEQLINFSNNAFYDGSLFVSPNTSLLRESPIQYHKVDGIWDKNTNLVEAEYVVDLINDILRGRENNETIGVITLNFEQMEEIERIIAKRSEKDSEFNKRFQEEFLRKNDGQDVGLFIRNLQNVQGDERDIIIISTAYAKNKDGKLMKRFGMLNNKGGENALNVAITRARSKIHIVTSLEPSDIAGESYTNEGPRYFADYLEYCKAVSENDPEAADIVLRRVNKKKDAPVEDIYASKILGEIGSFLADNGYKVQNGTGVGRCRFDLIVTGKDGRYVAGLELDTSAYNAIPTSTRERDYHKTMYLRGRGWNVGRIWTPLYYSDAEAEKKRILDFVRSCE